MTNSFIRPTDIKNMQRKHVEILRQEHTYLRLTLPESKKHDKPIVTLERAVEVYEQLTEEHAKSGHAEAENYVFMPEFANRDTACLAVKYGANVLELAKGKSAIEVGSMAELVPTLETLKAAVDAGELDAQIDT